MSFFDCLVDAGNKPFNTLIPPSMVISVSHLYHSVGAITISGICTRSGYVKMAPEEDINGLLVSDLLTDVLANPRSKNVNLFSDNEKQELIYKVRQR